MSKNTPVRPEGSEITSPLAEELMLQLMELRRNLVNAFNSHDSLSKFTVLTGMALENIENLENLIRPDIFSSASLEE